MDDPITFTQQQSFMGFFSQFNSFQLTKFKLAYCLIQIFKLIFVLEVWKKYEKLSLEYNLNKTNFQFSIKSTFRQVSLWGI